MIHFRFENRPQQQPVFHEIGHREPTVGVPVRALGAAPAGRVGSRSMIKALRIPGTKDVSHGDIIHLNPELD
jgi:hypothetical protein